MNYQQALQIVEQGGKVKRESWKHQYVMKDVVLLLTDGVFCHYGWTPSKKDKKAKDWIEKTPPDRKI